MYQAFFGAQHCQPSLLPSSNISTLLLSWRSSLARSIILSHFHSTSSALPFPFFFFSKSRCLLATSSSLNFNFRSHSLCSSSSSLTHGLHFSTARGFSGSFCFTCFCPLQLCYCCLPFHPLSTNNLVSYEESVVKLR